MSAWSCGGLQNEPSTLPFFQPSIFLLKAYLMLQSILSYALLSALIPVALFIVYTFWICVRFVPTIMRIFQERPLLRPPEAAPDPEAEDVRFRTSDGLWLQGSWLPARGTAARGTVVFCHEFLADRWSCRLYCDRLRDHGMDVFTFDFRNHGQSDRLEGYRATQWVSDHELTDLRAALAHVVDRTGAEGLPIYLFGISRGGGAAVLATALQPQVAALATDSAFPTHLMQLAYMRRWVGIYFQHPWIYRLMPDWHYALIGWVARSLIARHNGCRFPKVERAIRRVAPRPLLMIHGAKDSYVVPEIAQQLFALAQNPKQLCMVPEAKHNGAVLVEGDRYVERLRCFFLENSLNG